TMRRGPRCGRSRRRAPRRSASASSTAVSRRRGSRLWPRRASRRPRWRRRRTWTPASCSRSCGVDPPPPRRYTHRMMEGIVKKNPATGVVLGEVPVQGAEEVRAAVARARAAQAEWGALAVSERAARMGAFRAEVVGRAEEIIDLLVREGGKTKQEALGMEVILVADLTDWFAKHAADILAPQSIPLHLLKHRKSWIHYVPRGVIGV